MIIDGDWMAEAKAKTEKVKARVRQHLAALCQTTEQLNRLCEQLDTIGSDAWLVMAATLFSTYDELGKR